MGLNFDDAGTNIHAEILSNIPVKVLDKDRTTNIPLLGDLELRAVSGLEAR